MKENLIQLICFEVKTNNVTKFIKYLLKFNENQLTNILELIKKFDYNFNYPK